MHRGDSSPCSKVAGSCWHDACLCAGAGSVTKIPHFHPQWWWPGQTGVWEGGFRERVNGGFPRSPWRQEAVLCIDFKQEVWEISSGAENRDSGGTNTRCFRRAVISFWVNTSLISGSTFFSIKR